MRSSANTSHSLASQERLIQGLEEQVLFLTRTLEEERCRQQNQVANLTEEANRMRREREFQENESRALRKERDFWQKKSVEAMEGIRVHEEVLIAGFHSLHSRLCHLAHEARACRLLEESGGSFSDLSSKKVDTSESCGAGGTVDSNLEETLNALIELENELVPIISKLHSAYSLPLSLTQPSSSAAAATATAGPKISLSSFAENDLALFFPTPKGDYLAFNCGAPHHYLSAESKALIGLYLPPFLHPNPPSLSFPPPGQDKHFRKIYVLGKIVFKEERVATTTDSPYHLAPGIKFYEVSVASITSQIS
jgi:hypothetical protein